MDLSRIKNFIKHNGDKFIMLENGEPELVVMSFHEYEKLANGHKTHSIMKPRTADYRPEYGFPAVRTSSEPQSNSRVEPVDLEPTDFSETEFVSPSGFEAAGNLPIRLEDIRLEDLPI